MDEYAPSFAGTKLFSGRSLMEAARQFIRYAMWKLRSRNPQITTYFTDGGTTETKKGRPSPEIVRALRLKRQRLEQGR